MHGLGVTGPLLPIQMGVQGPLGSQQTEPGKKGNVLSAHQHGRPVPPHRDSKCCLSPNSCGSNMGSATPTPSIPVFEGKSGECGASWTIYLVNKGGTLSSHFITGQAPSHADSSSPLSEARARLSAGTRDGHEGAVFTQLVFRVTYNLT